MKLMLLSLLLLLPCVSTHPQRNPSTPNIPKVLKEISAANIEKTIYKLVSFGTRNTLSEQDNPTRGIGAARDWLYDQFSALRPPSGNRLIVEKQTYLQPTAPRIPQPTRITNIVAILPGTAPANERRYLIVSGHYDSICTSPTNAKDDAPGANDDASGTAAVLELARVLSPYQFEATLVFVCVAGEEQGLLGAAYLAEQAKQQGWHIQAMLTNDIIGNTNGGNGIRDNKTVRVFSEGIPSNETEAEARLRRSIGGEADAPSRQIARFIQETAAKYVRGMRVKLISRRDRYGRGGDHIPFNERGYPAIRFTEPNENYRHQHQDVRQVNGLMYGDLPEFVDFAYTANVTRVNAAALLGMALAPDVPKNVVLSTAQSYDSTLRWAAKPDLEYEVVWRETQDTNWRWSKRVGKVSQYTLKSLSKDDYLFGVRAINTAGYKSPVAYPRSGR